MGFGKRLSWLIIALIVFTSVGFSYKRVKCYTRIIYEIFEERFKEPFEVCYLLTSDSTLYKITSNDEVRINFRMYDLKRMLKKGGHSFSDVIVVIHNHLPQTSRDFSLKDIQTWYDFKAMGFTGNYYLLYQGNGMIYELREDEDNDS